MDLRYAFRILKRNPGFTAIAAVSLALGIGANAALFSAVNTLLLETLPYRDAGRLVYVSEYWPHEPVVPGPPSPDFANWRANSKLIDGIAAYGGGADALNLTGPGEPERIQGTMVTSGLLDLIGARLALGRSFTPQEDRAGGPPAAILGYGLWQRRFGASPGVIGKVIELNGTGYPIVGVLPSGFEFPDNNFRSELLVPMALPVDSNWHDDRNFRLLRVIARMKPGASARALKDELAAIVRAAASQEPLQMTTMRKDMEVRVTPLRDWLTGGVRRMMLVLQASVAMLLLIACLNVAGLQIARAASRQKEMAVRAAVGAGRGRLIRQLLTEGLLLSGLGGALGLALGYVSLGPLRAFLPLGLHLADGIRMDARVLWFTLSVAVGAGLLSGIAPALAASRPESVRIAGRQRLHGALVIGEIAVAMMLLVGSALFIRTFVRLASADPGFRPQGVLTLRVSLPQRAYPDAQAWKTFFTGLLDRARAIPGVESAAVSGGLPVIGARSAAGVSIDGQPLPPLGGRPSIPVAGGTPDYFRALGIPILRGRDFAEADESGPRVAIVNQAFAERFFPGEDALGKRIEVASRQGLWREIVGVAGNVKQQGRRPVDPFIIYLPFSQLPEPEALLILRSSRIPPAQLTAAAAAEVHAADPNLPVFDVATMEERLGQAVAPQHANMALMGVFAALALTLAGAGIFGMIAYFVNRRTHEIGIRMALGATQAGVLRLVLVRGMTIAATGIAAGIAGALILSRAVGSLLEGVETYDAAAYAGAAAIFALVAGAACFIPAREASQVDPMIALRHE